MGLFGRVYPTRFGRSLIFGAVVALSLHCVAGPAQADLGDCGQPLSTGASPVATDALFMLGAAVGTQTCELCVCDVNNDGSIAATDALIGLNAAVGQPVSLNCSPCGPVFCHESAAPACGGSCEDGLTCVTDPENGEECECLNDCEIGPAPTCGGSCASEDPGAICNSIRISPAGIGDIEVCECLPPGFGFCQDASAPGCDGHCGPGSECMSDGGGGCMCSALPVQPECSIAGAPSCLGTCADAPEGPTICESDGAGGCSCVPFFDQMQQTCFGEVAPICGGVCTSDQLCVSEGDGCECLAACELGSAPSCGGDCSFAGETCVVTTITVDGVSQDFCECWEVTP